MAPAPEVRHDVEVGSAVVPVTPTNLSNKEFVLELQHSLGRVSGGPPSPGVVQVSMTWELNKFLEGAASGIAVGRSL